MPYRAVIFDLGGVVFPSPFDAFDAYERTVGLPDRFIRTVVANSAANDTTATPEIRLASLRIPFLLLDTRSQPPDPDS